MAEKNNFSIYIEDSIINLDNKNLFNEIELFSNIRNTPDIENCIEIILSNNKLTKVIPDLSFLLNLKHLNLENNPIEDYNLLIKSLKTIPNLDTLKVSANKNDDLFISGLPNLRIFNGRQLKEDSNDAKVIIDIDQNDIDASVFIEEQQRYNHLFTKINEKVVKAQGKDSMNLFFKDYQKIINNNYGDTQKPLNKTNSGNLVNYYTNKCASKQEVLIYLMEKLLDLNEKKDKDLTMLMKEVLSGLVEVNTTQNEIVSKLLPKIENSEKMMMKKIDEAKRINNPSAEYDKLSTKYKNCKLECETYIDENNFMKERFSILEKENQILTDKVLKLTKDLTDNSNGKTGVGNLGSPDKFKAYYNIAKICSPKKNIKILTKKNMHDLIESIYESKTSYDKKCQEIRMPRETMEQHMYTFLNQKFGLKNLIIEWATSIINGIKMYASEDSDICLFGKIVRNEIEEDYRFIFKKLKSSVYDLLIVIFLLSTF